MLMHNFIQKMILWFFFCHRHQWCRTKKKKKTLLYEDVFTNTAFSLSTTEFQQVHNRFVLHISHSNKLFLLQIARVFFNLKICILRVCVSVSLAVQFLVYYFIKERYIRKCV